MGEFGKVRVIDDYGHHPVEIAAVLRAARDVQGRDKRVIAVVQPHRYTRLRDLFEQFSTCFNDADHVIVAPVYAAGEQPIDGISHESLVKGLINHGHRSAGDRRLGRSCEGCEGRDQGGRRDGRLPRRGRHHHGRRGPGRRAQERLISLSPVSCTGGFPRSFFAEGLCGATGTAILIRDSGNADRQKTTALGMGRVREARAWGPTWGES